MTDSEGGEVAPAQMYEIFADEYLPVPEMPWGRLKLRHVLVESDVDGETMVRTVIRDNAHHAREFEGIGHGNGPIAAFCDALAAHHIDVRVLDYSEHAMSAGGDAKAAAFVECAIGGRVLWGVGVDSSIVTASLKAIISAVNRAQRDQVG
jgi:2-isopropylmalate synthase